MDRPMTGIRPQTTTGLEMPKTSRGKSAALRRQVQDKSYWMSALKSKMKELTNEIMVITQENERMAEEEGRMGIFKKKAESLAKDISGLTHDLSVYNEFHDRTRIGDSVEEVTEDLEVVRLQNDDLHSRLEEGFEERKRQEAVLNSIEKEMTKKRKDINRIIQELSHEQTTMYSKLEEESVRLSIKTRNLEEELKKLSENRKQQETSIASGSDPFLRREILQALDNLSGLEKQKEDLTRDSSSRDQKGRLLAQVKRDNKEISSMDNRIRDLKTSVEDMKTDLEAYDDTEGIQRFRDLREKEKAMDTFLAEYEQEKEVEMDRLQELGSKVKTILDRVSRIIAHVDGLKATSTPSSKEGGIERLMDEKRKLELDLNKIEQLEQKLESEMETLHNKIKSLEKDLFMYSDIPKLKQDIESKSDSLSEEKERLLQQIEQLSKDNKALEHDLLIKKQSLESNEAYTEMRQTEKKLTQVLSVNEQLESSIFDSDHTFVKQRVLTEAKKYNQRLQGF